MITIAQLVIDLTLAAILGAVIGFERQVIKQFAGLRTHMLICLGSALITLLSMEGFPSDTTAAARIVANIIVAVGFIGGGTIIVAQREQIHGLTTAASVLVVAAIGIAIALHFYAAAIITTVLTLIILELWRIEVRLGLKRRD